MIVYFHSGSYTTAIPNDLCLKIARIVDAAYIVRLSPFNEQSKQFEVTGSKYISTSDQCL